MEERSKNRCGTKNSAPTATQQHLLPQCNINSIMARALKTGMAPINARQAIYGDFSNVEEYRTMCDKTIEAQQAFDRLPVFIRDRFHNSPAKLLQFLEDPTNVEEAIRIGLATKREPPAPAPKEEPKHSNQLDTTVLTDTKSV